MSSADTPFIPAVDDSWAILSEPPGSRDLELPDHWIHSLERSRRRREARRSAVAERGTTRVGIALAAATFGGTLAAAGVAGTGDAAAAPQRTGSLELSRGDRGPAVKALQRRLRIPADGIFGPQTERAVKRFQRRNGIPAIGRVGPRTTAALGITVRDRAGKVRRKRSVKRAAGPPAVRLTPAAARAMQAKLGVAVDGIVGPQTRRALERYEARTGLPADGRPDAEVLASLGVDPDARAPRRRTKPVEQGSTPPPASGKGAAAAVRHAQSRIGTPYAYGGTGPGGFDCSGLTQWAFKRAGIALPRTSFSQFGVGTPVKRSQIQPGDLVFFDASGPGASHVGIATGPSTVISATTRGVREHAISDSYWGSHYVGARRL